MQYSKLAAAFGVALFVAGGSLALAQQAPSGSQHQPDSAVTAQGKAAKHHGHGGMRQFLTPEQHAMWRMEHKAEISSMPREQRHAYKRQLREQFLAMTVEQQAKVRDELQAQWVKLSPERQQKVEQRIAMHQQKKLGKQPSRQQDYTNKPSDQVSPSQVPTSPPTNQL